MFCWIPAGSLLSQFGWKNTLKTNYLEDDLHFQNFLSSLGSYLLMLESFFCWIPARWLQSQVGWKKTFKNKLFGRRPQFFKTLLSSLWSYLLMLKSMFYWIPAVSLLSRVCGGGDLWEEWEIRLTKFKFNWICMLELSLAWTIFDWVWGYRKVKLSAKFSWQLFCAEAVFHFLIHPLCKFETAKTIHNNCLQTK